MAKLTRKTQKLFAGSAGANQIGQFGSLAAGAAAETTDPAVIQALSNYSTGWFGAVLGENSAALEDRNALDYLWGYQLSYVFQAGIPEYDSGTTYFTGSMVQDGNGNVRVSTIDNNTGNGATLLTDATGAKWRVPPGHLPIGSVIATFPNLTGAYSTAATTAADACGLVLCGGQTIADATSPMNGQVIPNINNSVFLMGYSTAGTTGGAATHSHQFYHEHQIAAFATSGANAGMWMLNSGNPGVASFAVNDGVCENALSQQNIYTSGSSQQGLFVNASSPSVTYSGGPISCPAGQGNTATTTSDSSLPPYISAVFLMRIK